MDIDPYIAKWVLEFLLRQPLGDRTLNSLLFALPLANNNPNLKKMLLLKKVEFEISRNNPVSEATLELLEQLEEIEFQLGNETVSDAMKRAYCAVAVDCTVNILKSVDDGNDCKRLMFFEAVKRVWKGRIERMKEVVEKGRMSSEFLWEWKDEIEAAVWDDSVCQTVVKKSGEVNAVEVVIGYIREEREKMGPSFLELVAGSVKSDKVLRGILGVDGTDQEAGKEAPPCDADQVLDGSNANKETHKTKIKLRDKLVGLRRSRGFASDNSRGAKIVDSVEMEDGPSYKKYNLTRSAEVTKVWQALERSSSELQAFVKDPLPDALELVDSISVEAMKNKRQDPAKDNPVNVNRFVVDDNGINQATDGNMRSGPSLMQRNSSARTYEWDESVGGSQEDPACKGILQLPSPKRINTSPLNKYEIKKLKMRRKGRKWSLLEEHTLRTGVEKYGKGNWKVILTAYRDTFEGRTEVDLKDKWRNMTRY